MKQQSFCVISGGSGCNAICGAFTSSSLTTFIIPISDDGGSSSEIQRVLGGPAIGDIRSRLIRLIPVQEDDVGEGREALKAIKRLLEHRLDDDEPSKGKGTVKKEWHDIVEGRHRLWRGIPNDRKECIRAFLVHLEAAILKKAQRGFNWKRASVGNLFLAGASLFLGSLPSAIFLFASITEIPHERFQVVPVVNTSSTATIAAELENGEVIVGQSEISHPSPIPIRPSTPMQAPTPLHHAPTKLSLLPPPSYPFPSHLHPQPNATSNSLGVGGVPPRASTPSLFGPPQMGDEDGDSALSSCDEDEEEERERERSRNVVFSKEMEVPLPSRIKRVYYLNPYGTEIFPRPNPLFVESLNTSTCLVYSCGSLYTSILPCLALKSIGQAIATSPTLKYKVLLLNSRLDRETGGYTASDFVAAVVDALREGDEGRRANAFVTHLVYSEQGQVEIDVPLLEGMGITCLKVQTKDRGGQFDEDAVLQAFGRIFV